MARVQLQKGYQRRLGEQVIEPSKVEEAAGDKDEDVARS